MEEEKRTEWLVYMDCPRHWAVTEIDKDDTLEWTKNCCGVFDTKEAAEKHAAILNHWEK